MPIEVTYEHAVGRGLFGGFIGIAILMNLAEKGFFTKEQVSEIVTQAHWHCQRVFPESNTDIETGADQEWKNILGSFNLSPR
jgi:hypothetical protein